MAIYLIISDLQNAELGKRVSNVFPEHHFKLSEFCWAVVSENKTSSSVRDLLELTGGAYGRTVVVKSAGVSGWFRKGLWEWLAAHEDA